MDHVRMLQEMGILPELCWWVCQMNGGGWFAVASSEKPSGLLLGERCSIAADSYRVFYGPATEADANEYMDDMEAS